MALVSELCHKAREVLARAKAQFALLAGKIPTNQYYRFNDHWRFIVQKYTFLVALIFFLEVRKLAFLTDVSEVLGSKNIHSYKIGKIESTFLFQYLPRKMMVSILMLKITLMGCFN